MSVGETSAAIDALPHERREGIASRSFVCLVITQILGTLNDNMFKWLAVPVGIHLLGPNSDAFCLSLGSFCFTLPYLVLATQAGYLADRFSKRTVIVACKIAEVAIVLIGAAALLSGHAWPLFVVVTLLGAQTALYGPAKFGSLPELLLPEKLSLGNGVMGLVTVSSSALGLAAGYMLFTVIKPDVTHTDLHDYWIPIAALFGVAVVGFFASLGIRPLVAARPTLVFPWNPIMETWPQLRLLGTSKPLLRTALGIAFFWALAALAQMNIAVFGKEELQLAEADISILMAVLVVGVGVGSVLAGIWSGGKVELGIVPLGAIGIVLSSLALFAAGSALHRTDPISTQRAFHWSCLWLFVLGGSSGLFSIPLDAYLQQRSPPDQRGSILAASNFVSFTGILGASGLFYVLQTVMGLGPRSIFLVAGLSTIPVAVYIFLLLPDATLRFLVWMASRVVYRVRVHGRENLPETGGALLVANHVTWADGVLLLTSSSRPIRMLAYADFVHKPTLRWVAKIFRVIPIKASEGPKALIRSLETARQSIREGDLVCIFAEGQLTRTGQLQPFQRGLLKIVEGTGAPVIPIYLDGLWGSIFSFSGGKFFWKWPRKLPYPVGIVFGKPLAKPDDVHQVRQAVQELGVEAVELRKSSEMVLPRQFLRMCRKSLFREKVADSMGQALTGGQLLLRTLLFRRYLSRVLGSDEKMVGVLLPPSTGGAIVNAALALSGRIAVNLNYTASPAVIASCLQQCGIKHVLSNRRFLEKLNLQLDAEIIYGEDVKAQITAMDKAVAATQAFATPAFVLDRLFGLTKLKPDDLLTIVFTSGSTGEPKGVMLSLNNIASNIDAINQLFHLKPTDSLLGILPFFHSFGITVTLWTVLTLEPKGVYHFNPLDARQIGTLCQEHKVTILMSTPTFLRTYIKRCEPEQFTHLDLVVVGAEKMPIDLAQQFEDKFKVRPIEGYGTTELSPLAAVNVPDHRAGDINQKGTKEGTVGRSVPGTIAKVVDPDTGADLGVDQPGLLLIKGPNVMQGYLNKPELTAQALRDGWYVTGDIAKIDAEGFIQITDRQSRFSKIGGEMVPHIKIEEMLAQILADGSENDAELKAVVTSVPDERKGERLIVIHKPLAKPLDEVYAALSTSGLPNLWLPSRDSFMQVEEIPVLGTGKLDLKGLKTLALDRLKT